MEAVTTDNEAKHKGKLLSEEELKEFESTWEEIEKVSSNLKTEKV